MIDLLKKKWTPVFFVVLGIIILAVVVSLPSLQEKIEERPIRQAKIGSSEGFARAISPIPFTFPRDHGPHLEFQTEWWYYTGNLQADNGEKFGYQLTFFRRALQPATRLVERESAWATDQVYLAHFALTSIDKRQFRFSERISRGAAGLAGATGEPLFKVWLEDWRVEQLDEKSFKLRARDTGLDLELTLVEKKGLVFHGDRGLSQKGPEPGNASYYISQTRLETKGKLVLGQDVRFLVGESWMDHEYSTSALGKGQVGWDWFSLQISDQTELMVYTIRRADGTIDPFSQGTLIRSDGTTRTLNRDDFQIQKVNSWRSLKSNGVYPSGWLIRIPSENMELRITPRLEDQELMVSFVYWEGAVEVKGNSGIMAITGSGYVELTGYAHSMEGEF